MVGLRGSVPSTVVRPPILAKWKGVLRPVNSLHHNSISASAAHSSYYYFILHVPVRTWQYNLCCNSLDNLSEHVIAYGTRGRQTEGNKSIGQQHLKKIIILEVSIFYFASRRNKSNLCCNILNFIQLYLHWNLIFKKYSYARILICNYRTNISIEKKCPLSEYF